MMNIFPRFFGKSGLILATLIFLFLLASCHKPQISGYRVNINEGNGPPLQTDYQKDMEGRTEFPRSYIQLSTQLRIRSLSYNQTILYSVDDSIWNAGFTVDITDPITGNIEVYVRGVNPGDGTTRRAVRFFNNEEKLFHTYVGNIESTGYGNIAHYGGGSQELKGLVLFTKVDDGTLGYIKLPPIHINIAP